MNWFVNQILDNNLTKGIQGVLPAMRCVMCGLDFQSNIRHKPMKGIQGILAAICQFVCRLDCQLNFRYKPMNGIWGILPTMHCLMCELVCQSKMWRQPRNWILQQRSSRQCVKFATHIGAMPLCNAKNSKHVSYVNKLMYSLTIERVTKENSCLQCFIWCVGINNSFTLGANCKHTQWQC